MPKFFLLPWMLGAASIAAAQPAACADFYGHVNHDWLARTVLPPDRPRIGSFDELRIANDRVLERAMGRLLATLAPWLADRARPLPRGRADGPDAGLCRGLWLPAGRRHGGSRPGGRLVRAQVPVPPADTAVSNRKSG